MGNLFTTTGRVNCVVSLEGPKINKCDPKIIPLSNYEEEWLLLAYYLSTCLSWSFVLTRCYTLTWVTNIMMRAISKVHAGHRFSTPGINSMMTKCCNVGAVAHVLEDASSNVPRSPQVQVLGCPLSTAKWSTVRRPLHYRSQQAFLSMTK